MSETFACLHTRSWYSLLEGTTSPADLLARAAQLGYDSLALTDVNSLAGIVEFVQAARKSPVSPIVGCRVKQGFQAATVLVAESAGWANLCRVVSRAHLDSKTPLAKILSACAEGLHVLADDPGLITALKGPFGPRLWAEVWRPRPELQERRLLDAAQSNGVRPVATLAALFCAPEEHPLYRLLCAARQKIPLDDLDNRKAPATPSHHLCSVEEVHKRFRDIPEAVANARQLASLCRPAVLPVGEVLPLAEVPQGQDAAGYLALLCERALPERQPGEAPVVRARLEHEMGVINARGLAPYFLACHEIAREAKALKVPMGLRGSAGGSLVCYLLGVGNINPLRHNLRFERFLNVGRPDLPDIDMEFESGGRAGVIAAAVRRFGGERSVWVGSLHRAGAPTAFKFAAWAHGLNRPGGKALLAALSQYHACLSSPLDEDISPPPEWHAEPDRWPVFLADAARLLGRPFALEPQDGALVLTPGPAEGFAPLVRRHDGGFLTCLDKDAVEAIGLLKIDLLASRALATEAEAMRYVAAGRLPGTPAPTIPDEGSDAATLALLARGETLGVPQLETPTPRRLLVQLRPRGVDQLAQAMAASRSSVALWRDAFIARRRGFQKPDFAHRNLEEVLAETHGLILTEDDALGVVEALTGWPPAEADRLRRRLAGKKSDPQGVREALAEFVAACEQKEIKPLAAQKVAEQLVAFCEYGFNRAHAVYLAAGEWRECYLKANNPLAFWSACLNNHNGNCRRWCYLEEVKRTGLTVRLPCINHSWAGWSPEVSGLRAGLSQVLALSREQVQRILEERQQGAFVSVRDFRDRCVGWEGTLGPLIRAGAFDFLCVPRAALLREAGLLGERQAPGEADAWLFETDPPGWPLMAQWKQEWAELGFLAGPPLLSLVRPHLGSELADSRSLRAWMGEEVTIAGFVAFARKYEGEKGTTHLISAQDEHGIFEVRYYVQSDGEEPDLTGGPHLFAGVLDDAFGAPVLNARMVERFVARQQGRAEVRVVSEAS